MRCPSCRNHALGVVAMLTLPNTHRQEITCRRCGTELVQQPMHSVGESAIVWGSLMVPIASVALLGGSVGFGLGVIAVGLLLWVAPWQGLTYALPPTDPRDALPEARVLRALPPGESGEGSGGVPRG